MPGDGSLSMRDLHLKHDPTCLSARLPLGRATISTYLADMVHCIWRHLLKMVELVYQCGVNRGPQPWNSNILTTQQRMLTKNHLDNFPFPYPQSIADLEYTKVGDVLNTYLILIPPDTHSYREVPGVVCRTCYFLNLPDLNPCPKIATLYFVHKIINSPSALQ